MATEFGYHNIDDEAQKVCDYITHAAEQFDHVLSANLGASRERSLAVTKLEEACFWAKKAATLESIARNTKERA